MHQWVVIFSLLLSSCIYAPKQDFAPNSPFYLTANPEVKVSELNRLEQMNNHKVLIAIIDSGVDYNQPRIQKHLRSNHDNTGIGYDLLGNDPLPYPILLKKDNGEVIEDITGVNQHGTHVASLALLGGKLLLPKAQEKTDIGPSLGLVPIRGIPLSDEGFAEGEDDNTREQNSRVLANSITNMLTQAIRYALVEGVHIVNMSLGIATSDFHENVKDEFEQLIHNKIVPLIRDEGNEILFVSAAGNESIEVVAGIYPAALKFPNTLTVGALDNHTTISDYTNYGDLVDVYIRGTDIIGLVPEGQRTSMSGTSMASPLIVNIAAKMKLIAPCMSAADLKQGIILSSEDATLPVTPTNNGNQQNVLVKKVKVASFKNALKYAASFCK